MIKNIMKNIGTKKHYPTVGEYAADGPIEQREAMQKLLKEAKPSVDKKKFIEMVYDYGASGDKTLEGLNDNQKQAIASAWATFQAEDEENETDEKFGSFYSDFMGK